ncbi:MAG: hypothetical protein MR717_08475 [Prevotella sp.]|nr:hypothetical protein [Prevotella sp.]
MKRKFLDCGDDFDCKVIVRLINHIYHLDHKHSIGQDAWTEAKHRKWRKDMCKPIMKIIRKKARPDGSRQDVSMTPYRVCLRLLRGRVWSRVPHGWL